MSSDKPRIDKIQFKTYRPRREPPKAGDKKIIKGVMHVRCYAMAQQYGGRSPYLRTVSRGKPNYTWVPESEVDEKSFMPREYAEHNRRIREIWENR